MIMKRIQLLYMLFLPLLSIGQQYTVTKNYVVVKKYLDPTTSIASPRTTFDMTYLDGLGRKLQDIQVSGSPDGKGDIVLPYHHGLQGRIERMYLPYTKSDNQGKYIENAFSSSNWNVYGVSDAPYAFTSTIYDNSPINRIVKQTGPGKSWHENGKATVITSGTNLDNEVRLYRVTSNGLSIDGYYPAGTLQKITTTDEDGKQVISYTDRENKTILTVSVVNNERLETFHVYDFRGLLRFVLSPEASYQLGNSIDEGILQRLAYRYNYDCFGHLIEKRLPGCDPIYMVYDKRDRLVMSQDGIQRSENINKWSYSLYDNFNRVIESGEVISSVAVHSTLLSLAANSTNFLPTGERTPLQYTLYDSYIASSDVPVLAFQSIPGYSNDYHKFVTGLVTSMKTRILGTNIWLTTSTYYDSRCRVIQTVSNNPQGGTSLVSMKYDFAGNIIQQQERHQVDDETNVLENINLYDNRNRLLSSSNKLNDGTPAFISYTYDEVGRLVKKKYGNIEETMTYNIRGWLTSKESIPFKMKLRYETPEGGTTAYWNGNISEWEWQHASSTTLGYGFTYDGLNRLIESVQIQKSDNSWYTFENNYIENGITYDRNGNIKSLQRTAEGVIVDNLTYTYNGNQLSRLTENGQTSSTKDVYARGSTASGSYTYDKNGNMINDSRKNLNLSYNILDLLSEVKFGNVAKVKYSYLSDGTKLQVRDDNNNGFDYLGSLTYKNSSTGLQLESASVEGGVIRVNNTNNGNIEVNYFLTDHLGSIRAIINGNGVVQERNDYYPFGARHLRDDYPQLAANRFKYNGKEEQVTGNLNYVDYGARMYDSALGRWFSTDPLLENYMSHSPYNYCVNNPLIYLDPNGNYVTNYVDEDYNLLVRTNDGSEDVVVVPKERQEEFLTNYIISTRDPGRVEKAGWNNYWKDELGVARTLTNEEMFWINQFSSKWSRGRALKFVLNNSGSNQLMLGVAHLVSSYASPTGVLMIGMGITMLPSVKPAKLVPREFPVISEIPGTKVPRTLRPGEIIDRFGEPTGNWASPIGTSYEARSIRPGSTPYNRYKVVKPIKVEQSLASPGELPGQYGYGVQYQFTKPIKFYLKEGYLKKIN